MKDWRKELDKFQKERISYGMWDFEKKDWMPRFIGSFGDNLSDPAHEGRVLDIKGYDPIILDKDMNTQRAYEFYEGDLDAVSESKVRNERLSPELMIDDVPMIDDKFMLVQNNTYRVYLDYIIPLHNNYEVFDLILTAKALNYGFQIQTHIMLEKNYNPVVPFYDNTLGYIISTNLWTPVTVNIPMGTKLVYLRRNM